MKTIGITNWNNRLKSIETKNIKKYGESLTWTSLERHFNDCIIQITEGTIIFDEKKYKEIRKKLCKKEQ